MAVLELWGPYGHDVVPLEGTRLAVGTSSAADIVIKSDSAVSRRHAVLEQVAGSWAIRDLGSTNGTHVNGEHLFGERVLRDGDEILLGRTRLVYRDSAAAKEPSTEGIGSTPLLTRREHDVLVELCRPLLSGNPFTAPASVRDIAEALVVTEAAVKQHLSRLYDKFLIEEYGREPRRIRLANDALQTGSVSMADLKERPKG